MEMVSIDNLLFSTAQDKFKHEAFSIDSNRLLKKGLFQGKLILMIYICLPGVDWKSIFVLFSYPKCQYILPQ